jgi:hypothetical protein
VPATGCLSGYNLGFGAAATATPTAGASRFRSASHPIVGGIWETLQGMITISSGALNDQLAAEELDAVINQEIEIIQEAVAAEAAAQVVVTKEDAENPMSGGSIMRTLFLIGLLTTLFFVFIFMTT